MNTMMRAFNRGECSRWSRVAALAIMPFATALAGPRPAPAEVRPAPLVEVIAGRHLVGDGGPATDAVLVTIGGLAVDPAGNLYFSDSGHNRVRRVDAETGTIETVAGTGYMAGDDSGSSRALETHLKSPGPLALSADGRHLFVGEILGGRIRHVDLREGTIEELDRPEEGFSQVSGLLWQPDGLVVVESTQGQIWKRGEKGWEALLPEEARLIGGARSIARDSAGRLYVAEYFTHRILRWDGAKRKMAVYAGIGESGKSDGGPAAKAGLRTPDGLAFDEHDNLYFSDMGNRRICRVDARSGRLATVYRAGKRGTDQRFTPGPLAYGKAGGLWMGDVYRNRILRFAADAAEPEVVAGGGEIGDGGPAINAYLSHPGSVVADGDGNIYFSDAVQHRVRRIDHETGRITTVAGAGTPGYNGDMIPATQAWLSYPGEILVDSRRLFISDYYNHRVRMVDLAGGSIVTVAGSGDAGESGDGGPAPMAQLLNPHALYLDHEDNSLIVASAVSSRLRRIDLASGTIGTVPVDVDISPDMAFYSIARWKDGLVFTTPRPSGVYYLKDGKIGSLFTHPEVYFPQDVAVSPDGDLYICETGRNRILKWDGAEIEVVVENLGRPRAMSFDANGDLLVADTFHSRILRVRIGSQAQGRGGRGTLTTFVAAVERP